MLGSPAPFAKQAASAAHNAGLISGGEIVAARELHQLRDRAVNRWSGLVGCGDLPPQLGVAEVTAKGRRLQGVEERECSLMCAGLTAHCEELEWANCRLKEEVDDWCRC